MRSKLIRVLLWLADGRAGVVRCCSKCRSVLMRTALELELQDIVVTVLAMPQLFRRASGSQPIPRHPGAVPDALASHLDMVGPTAPDNMMPSKFENFHRSRRRIERGCKTNDRLARMAFGSRKKGAEKLYVVCPVPT